MATRKRSFYIQNLIIAGILWLTGEGFLLIPTRLQTITGVLSNLSISGLGTIFVFTALAISMMVLISASPRQQRILMIAGAAILTVLAILYLEAKLYIEFLLLFGLAAANLITSTSGEVGAQFEAKILSAAVTIINAASGIFLLIHPALLSNHIYSSFGNFKNILGGIFLLSAFLCALIQLRPSKNISRLLNYFLAIPWVIWAGIFLFVFNLPNLIAPLVLAFAILLKDSIPWEKFILPDGDMLGRRLILIGCVGMITAIAVLAMLLNLLDRSLVQAGIVITRWPIREATFGLFTIFSMMAAYGISTITMTINGLMIDTEEKTASFETRGLIPWNERIARYLRPFSLTRDGLRARLDAQSDQINALTHQLAMEKHRAEQLNLLVELSQQLETQLDQPVSAQLAVNTLEKAIECSFVCLYLHEPERREYVVLASAGSMAHTIPPGYRQNITRGIIGRATRLRKTQIINDVQQDSDYFRIEGDTAQSSIVIPLIYAGHIKGIVEVNSDKVNAFNSSDVSLAETIAAELVRAWERSNYHSRLMELIQAGISLSTMVNPETTVQEIATIARQTLEARFTYVSLMFDREENLAQKATSGHAPRLLQSLEKDLSKDALFKASLNATQPFRVRDIRKYNSSQINIDHNGLRSLLVIPIRLHTLNIGSILAFGKQREVFFTENDESLASLLASQAAAAIEGVWLQQELRTTLQTTRLLYELSYHIIQAEKLSDAAQHIAHTAHRLGNATVTGIVLFTSDRQIEAELQVDSEGTRSGVNHPMEMVDKVMKTGRVIYQSVDQNFARVYLPIHTPMRTYGVLWLTIPETRGYKSGSPTDLQTLTNQAALALERALLLVESRRQAKEIEAAYRELELAYDRTLAALMSALDARDRETEGHSSRVSLLATKLGEAMGLSAQQLKALERGSLLHDIGKIGVSDTILHKPGPLNEKEWASMRLHPDIGARIVEGIPFLQETLPVIRYHQERWDGSGYPLGLSGKDIPLLARIFSVVDAFDALTSNRPYRQKVSFAEAAAYLREQAGVHFDPEIVTVFDRLVSEGLADILVSE